MGMFFELVDFEQEFIKATKTPTILNDLRENTEKEKEFVNSCIYTRYTSDLLSNIPTCQCGKLFGQNVMDVECPECNTPVRSSIEIELDPLIWIRSPNGVAPLINPTAWEMICNRYTTSGFNVIRWIADLGYKPNLRKPQVLTEIQALNIPRGYNAFVENFDKIIETLNSLGLFKLKPGEVDYTLLLIKKFRKQIFTRYLPIINKSILVFEDDNQGSFVDSTVPGIVNAARIMVGIDVDDRFTQKQRENRAIKAIVQLSEVYQQMNGNSFLSGKPGLIRKHMLGTRSYYSFRTVISSMTQVHHYRELHIPWGVATSVFKIHLVNKLLKRGMTANQAVGHIYAHARKYCPLLDELFNELIASSIHPNLPYVDVRTGETKYLKGIACTMARNPSLNVNSIQLCYITRIKTDITDQTTSIPILSVEPLNADFDGDAINFTLVLDNFLHEQLSNLSFDSSVLDLSSPMNVSGALAFPKPVISTISHWYRTQEPANAQKYEELRQLLDA